MFPITITTSAWPLLLLLGAMPAAHSSFQSSLQITTLPSVRPDRHWRSIRPGDPRCAPSTRTHTRLHSGGRGGGSVDASPPSEPSRKTLVGDDIYADEEVVKKSRFLGYAARCSGWDDAQTIIDSVRQQHPKCRHVCFGFVASGGVGGDAGTERCSDGGEPTGTAGAPILGAVKGEGLADTVVVVVRYFGGVKLGAGGLIRAYGGAARRVLRSAPTVVLVPKCTLRLSTRTANVGGIYSAAAKFGGTTSGETYNERGELEVTVTCDQRNGSQLKQAIVDATRGGVVFIE